MMINKLSVMAAVLVGFCTLYAQNADTQIFETNQEETANNNFVNMGRGFVNIVTSPLEVPRDMLYRNSQIVLWGFIGGAVEGAGMAGLRAFAGVTDVISFGFNRGEMFNNSTFKPYIWNSDWLPEEKK